MGRFRENMEGSDGYITRKQCYVTYQRVSVPKGNHFTVSLRPCEKRDCREKIKGRKAALYFFAGGMSRVVLICPVSWYFSICFKYRIRQSSCGADGAASDFGKVSGSFNPM